MKQITVLLADDSLMVRKSYLKLLKLEADLQVVGEAKNGQQAVALVKKLRPAVVLMDVAMPLMNGIEALRQILKAAPATKVLMLSSHTANPAWARASTRPRSTKLTSTSRRYSCRLRERTRPTVICAAWRRLAPVAN